MRSLLSMTGFMWWLENEERRLTAKKTDIIMKMSRVQDLR